MEISAGNELAYQVMHGNDTILSHSNIGLVLENGTIVGKTPRITGERRRKIKDNIESPFYRFKEFVATGNELDLKLKGGFGIIFRAYNEGVAYRFYTTQSSDIIIKEEQAEFNFKEDYTAYLPYTTNDKKPMAMAYQNVYDITPLSKAQPKLAFLPVTVDCGSVKLTLLESDLEAYPGMFVQSQQGKYGLKGVFAPYPAKTDFYPWRKQEYVTETTDFISRSRGSRSYPWRVLAITEKDTDMPVNNLVYALASPNRIGDTSWIKTGKVAWDWWNDWNLKGVPFKAGINMDTYKYYIDFASRNGLEFIVLDEGWYAPKSGDMLTVIPELDLPELIAYGKSKGVEIVLWTVFNVLDSQLEAACKKYADMGIKGFKVDFLDRDDQTAETLNTINDMLDEKARSMGFEPVFFQSNSEGALIDRLHESRLDCAGVILNAGAYTHYSYAIRDAIAAIRVPVIEVHLSNVNSRDEFRKNSVIAPVCRGTIAGFGSNSYVLALYALENILGECHD